MKLLLITGFLLITSICFTHTFSQEVQGLLTANIAPEIDKTTGSNGENFKLNVLSDKNNNVLNIEVDVYEKIYWFVQLVDKNESVLYYYKNYGSGIFEFEIKTTSYDPGIYTILVSSKGKMESKKIVIN
ncbi:MAG: hypothetical protein ACOCWG_05760 [bacterium]